MSIGASAAVGAVVSSGIFNMPMSMADMTALDLLLINICDAPVVAVFTWCTLGSVAPSRRAAYIALQVLALVLVILFDSTGAYQFVAVESVCLLALSCLFHRASPARRALFLSLRMVALMVSMGVGIAFWLIATDGLPTSSALVCRQNLGAHAAAALVVAVVLFAAVGLMDRVAQALAGEGRAGAAGEGTASASGAASPNAGAGAEEFVAIAPFVAMQAILLFAFTTCAMLFEESIAAYWCLLGLEVACVAADALLLRALHRRRELHALQLRVELGQRELAAQTEASEVTVARIEALARFRHDMRNQLASLQALIHQGDRAGAYAFVRELRHRIDAMDDANEPGGCVRW